MNTNSDSIFTIKARAARADHDILRRLGFEHRDDGYRRGDLLFHSADGWSSLSLPAATGENPLGILGRPGPWKHVHDGERHQLVFALTKAMIHEADRDDAAGEREGDESGRRPSDQEADPAAANAPALHECIAWAHATSSGASPTGWQSPAKESIDEWTAGRLTVRSGSVVRQIEVIHAPDRMAVRVPLVSGVADELAEPRRRWQRQLLIDTQNRWHLVRLGLAPDAEPGFFSAFAEVDLTGAPRRLARRLFLTSLDSLAYVAGGLVETLAFLADASVEAKSLEACPRC